MRVRAHIPIPLPGIIAFLAVALIIGHGLAFPSGEAASAAIDRPSSAHSAGAPAGAIPAQTNAASLPLNFERHIDDLDGMVRRRDIRALVFYSRSGFFYVNGRPQGIYYEALRAFEQTVNQKLQTGKQHVQVTFIPVRPEQAKRPSFREWAT